MEAGYAPEALRNYLCLLGWSPKDNREMLATEEILELFELESVNRRNAIFDSEKCFWLNGQHVLQMSLGRFCELSFLGNGLASPFRREQALMRALAIVKPRLNILATCRIGSVFSSRRTIHLRRARWKRRSESPERLNACELWVKLSKIFRSETHASIEAKLKESAVALGVKAGELVHPARVAVTGKSIGPGLYETLEILGRERVLERFKRAAELATQKFAPTGSG